MITDVRPPERVQDISDEDAKAEACELLMKDGTPITQAWPEHADLWDYRLAFEDVWNSLHAKSGHGWDQNDYVWPISFKVVP